VGPGITRKTDTAPQVQRKPVSTTSELIPVDAARPPATSADGGGLAFTTLPATRRPDPALMTYYVLGSILLGPFFLFYLIPSYFKYRSLRYTVEEEGISMRWGVLFRREISLTYSRIQDIHLSSNFLERWLGLAKIQVQTASGSSSAEMTIEGLREFGAVRDFLYGRMRGARDRAAVHTTPAGGGELGGGSMRELAETLNEIAAEVRGIRRALLPPGSEEASSD
jgi:membrane protein YdbS with pleckstrin-like domain